MRERTAEHTVRRDQGATVLGSVPSDQLFLVLEGARPLAGGARSGLDGVDEVRIRRGSARAMIREREGELRVLTLKVPDKLLSSSHARLLRTGAGWTLVDDGSTNGTRVHGEVVRARVLGDGDAFEVGAAHFLLRLAMPMPENASPDVESAALAGRAHGLASLVPAHAQALAAVAQLATSSLSVLFLGASGTGKDVLANAIHTLSGRPGPFVPVNCGALTATLVESQLFGHTKGSFSGALRDEPGFVRSSDGGTLFLDEIGDLPPASQAALLRVLETRAVTPVGSTRAVPVDLRVVSATLRSVESLRPDLHARLAAFTHVLTPLRDRKEDLGLLLAEILPRLAGARAASLTFTPEAGRALAAYDFPLNVRELSQALGVALVLAQGSEIDVAHLPRELVAGGGARRAADAPLPGGDASDSGPPDRGSPDRGSSDKSAPDKDSPVAPPPVLPKDDAGLRAVVVAALEAHRGNVSEVSRALGRTRMQIHRWMRRFGLDPASFRG